MKLDILHLVLDAGPVVKLVMLILVIFSVLSWGIILTKYRLIGKTIKQDRDFLNFFWDGASMDASYRKSGNLPHSLAAIAYKSAYAEYRKTEESLKASALRSSDQMLLENTERAFERAVNAHIGEMEKNLSFLATTGSAAPFIGLFGTVWGIMNSFLNIGATGATNLAVVAPGISEALIATALGLFAAIPAVMGYNYCISKIRGIHKNVLNFGADYYNALKRAQVKAA